MPAASEAISPHAITKAWIWIAAGILLLAAVAAAFANLVREASTHEGISIVGFLAVFAMFLILPGIYALIFGIFALRAHRRIAAVALLRPSAWLTHAMTTPTLRAELRAVALGAGVPSRVPFLSYIVIAADSASIRVYSKGGNPRLVLELPTSSLAQATFQPVTVGVRTLVHFVFDFTGTDGQRRRVAVLPIRWPGVIMRSLRPEAFPAELAAMQRATHPGTVPAA